VVSSLSKPTSGSSGPSAQPPEGDDEKDPKKSKDKIEASRDWRSKIHGNPQKTGTEGHDWQSAREGIKKAKDPNVAEVHFDRPLNKITGGKTSSKMRPDVTTVRKDGKIITDEIRSDSQTISQLQRKIQKMQDLLPSKMRGPRKGGRVISIKK
jgi:hypothetical protein